MKGDIVKIHSCVVAFLLLGADAPTKLAFENLATVEWVSLNDPASCPRISEYAVGGKFFGNTIREGHIVLVGRVTALWLSEDDRGKADIRAEVEILEPLLNCEAPGSLLFLVNNGFTPDGDGPVGVIMASDGQWVLPGDLILAQIVREDPRHHRHGGMLKLMGVRYLEDRAEDLDGAGVYRETCHSWAAQAYANDFFKGAAKSPYAYLELIRKQVGVFGRGE